MYLDLYWVALSLMILKLRLTKQKANTDKEESDRSLYGCATNYNINRKNCAGIFYIPRDCEILKGNLKQEAERQNAKILSYLYPYTNKHK